MITAVLQKTAQNCYKVHAAIGACLALLVKHQTSTWEVMRPNPGLTKAQRL